jgi:hypothetical protein
LFRRAPLGEPRLYGRVAGVSTRRSQLCDFSSESRGFEPFAPISRAPGTARPTNHWGVRKEKKHARMLRCPSMPRKNIAHLTNCARLVTCAAVGVLLRASQHTPRVRVDGASSSTNPHHAAGASDGRLHPDAKHSRWATGGLVPQALSIVGLAATCEPYPPGASCQRPSWRSACAVPPPAVREMEPEPSLSRQASAGRTSAVEFPSGVKPALASGR